MRFDFRVCFDCCTTKRSSHWRTSGFHVVIVGRQSSAVRARNEPRGPNNGWTPVWSGIPRTVRLLFIFVWLFRYCSQQNRVTKTERPRAWQFDEDVQIKHPFTGEKDRGVCRPTMRVISGTSRGTRVLNGTFEYHTTRYAADHAHQPVLNDRQLHISPGLTDDVSIEKLKSMLPAREGRSEWPIELSKSRII